MALHNPDRVDSRAQPPLRKGAGARGPDRVPGFARGLRDRGRPARRLARRRARPAPAGPRVDPPRAALSRGPRRDAQEEHLFRRFPHGQPGGIQRGSPDRARQRRPDPGPRLGRPRALRPARHGPDPARDPRARRGTPAGAPPARESRRAASLGGPVRAHPAPGRHSPDPPEPVRGAHGGSLPHLGGPRRRGRARHENDARVPRVVARQQRHRRHARPLDRRLRRSRQLHVHALPLGKRGGARLLLVARDRPHPRGGPRRSAAGRARSALPEVRARPARPRDPRTALPRRGLPDRESPGPGPPAPQHRSLRQLRRARKSRGVGGSSARRTGERRDPERAHRRRRPQPRSGPLRDPRTQRGVAQPLRDADAGARGHAHRALDRLGGVDGERREAISVPAASRRAVPRRAAPDGARRALLLGAASDDGDREPVAAVAHPRRPAAHCRRDHRPRGLPHRLAERVLHRPREARRLLPGRHLLFADRHSPGRHRRRRRERRRREPSGPVPSGSWPSTPDGGSSSSAIRRTGGRGTRTPTGSFFVSASLPRRSAASSSPAGSRSPSTCSPPTPRRSGTIPGSPPATGRIRD